MNVTIAGIIYFGWVDANHQKNIDISLFTQDRELVVIDDHPVQVTGPVEVGRPAGLVEGSEIELPIATRFEGISLDQGRYEWRMSINGELIASAVFDVIVATN